MEATTCFTEGKVLSPLIRFALPILFAIFLQTMYGAVDMLIVGQFSAAGEVSAVSTGSWIMQTVTSFITGLAMGTTVLLGNRIGAGKAREGSLAVGASILLFLAITAIVNSLGVIPSAGVGVAEKICGFVMMVPSAYMQAMSAFVAQNIGAGRPDRAKKALAGAIGTSLAVGVFFAYFTFFHGELLAQLFAREPQIIEAAAQYLKAYAFDCLLVSFLFCIMGYFNGCGKTAFVMIQGIIGAFCVRIPVSWLMSRAEPVSLFGVGLATPASTAVQLVLCAGYFWLLYRRGKNPAGKK